MERAAAVDVQRTVLETPVAAVLEDEEVTSRVLLPAWSRLDRCWCHNARASSNGNWQSDGPSTERRMSSHETMSTRQVDIAQTVSERSLY